MHFSIGYVLVALAVVSSVAATPTGGASSKRGAATATGHCNGTSCTVGLDNFECNVGSCAAAGGGDGKPCTVVDYPDNSRKTFCPNCGDPNLCPTD